MSYQLIWSFPSWRKESEIKPQRKLHTKAGLERVSLVEVARAAYVSPMTVSNFIDGKFDTMSEATRKRVAAAIRDLGDRRNTNANSLRSKKDPPSGSIIEEGVPGRLSEDMRFAQSVDRNTLSGSALRAFFKIADLWGLSNEKQMTLLGRPSPATFYRWKKKRDGSLSKDTLERISYLLGIYKALQILLPDPARADAWVRQPNQAPPFAGRSALDRMLSGNVADLYIVRQYLDAQRGGWS